MRSALMVMMAGCMLACGEGSGEGDPPEREPESMVPVGVLSQAESPFARQCLIFHFVGDARVEECSTRPPERDDTSTEDKILTCTEGVSGDFMPRIQERIWACPEYWANAPCDDLVGDWREPDSCALVHRPW